MSASIVSCIKVMAKLDITERRLPQDGQISTTVAGRDIGLRVSTVPGKYGEATVIRLLDRTADVVDIDKLGMDTSTRDRFEDVIIKPQGLVLVTGPTGSGKTTTLYAVLNLIRSSLKNIFTLEDPIECELLASSVKETGVTQVQVNSKIGLTFATGLRAALRQDPDVIMVGEIRDRETAEAAMKAAMTGHLVLSTLHTNDAASTIIRLRDIGIEPYLIGSTITGIMAQRLLRLLCSECKQAYETPAQALGNLFPQMSLFPDGAEKASLITLYRPAGCARCHGTGYWGRYGIFELLLVNDEIRRLIHEGATAEAMKKAAQADGLKTLRESGCKLVLQGLTTVEEVFQHTVD
jgi:general secretion pathway protein E